MTAMDETEHLRVPDGIWTLPVLPPFQFQEIVQYLSRSTQEVLFGVESGVIYRLVVVGAEEAAIEITGTDRYIQIRFVDSPLPSLTVQEKVVQFVKEWLDLDRDLTPFYQQMRQCPIMGKVVEKHQGLRLVGIPDLFEALAWAIIGQQITLSFAYMLKHDLVTTFGPCRTIQGREYWRFPSPQRMAQVDLGTLRELRFSRQKATYLISVANQLAKGDLSKSQLLNMGDFRAMEAALTQLPGIGPWSAHYVLMRCLRDPTAFPVQDVGLQNAVKTQMGTKQKPTVSDLRQLASRWAGWEAYATFYLWKTLY